MAENPRIPEINELLAASADAMDADNYERARQATQEALDRAAELDERELMARASVMMGIINVAEGLVDEGVDYIQDAIRIYRRAHLFEQEAATIRLLIGLRGQAGPNDEVVRLYRRAISLYRQADEHAIAMVAQVSLAELFVSDAQHKAALKEAEQAWRLAQRNKSPDPESVGLLTWVTVQAHLGLDQTRQAHQAAERGLRALEGTDDPDALAYAHTARGIVAWVEEDEATFRSHLDEALRRKLSLKSKSVAETEYALYHARKGDPQEAFAHLDALRRALRAESGVDALSVELLERELERDITFIYAGTPPPEGEWPTAPQAETLIQRGLREMGRGNPNRASRPLEQALDRSRRAGDIPHVIESLKNLALAHSEMEAYEEARDSADELADLYRVLEQELDAARWFLWIADLAVQHGAPQDALEVIEAAAPLLDAEEHPGEMARLHQARGQAHALMDEPDAAAEAFDMASDLAAVADDVEREVRLLIDRAKLAQRDDPEEAGELLDQAYRTAAATGDIEGQVSALSEQADLADNEGDTATALARVQQAYDLLEKHNALRSEQAMRVLLGLGRLQLVTGNEREGKRHLREAQRLARRHNSPLQHLARIFLHGRQDLFSPDLFGEDETEDEDDWLF
jgi:tetratricopeptide (TPR) repeat protein